MKKLSKGGAAAPGKSARKLAFNRETLRSLSEAQLERVAGGAASACNAGCLTCNGTISCPVTK